MMALKGTAITISVIFVFLYALVPFGKFETATNVESDSQSHCSAEGKCSLEKEANPHDSETLTEQEHQSRYSKDSVPLIPVGEKPILIWWTKDLFPHDRRQKNYEISCNKGACITSIDRGLKNDPATRGFIFYGTDLRADDLPLPRRPWDEWALFHEESPKNNWMLTFEDALVLFNHTATFRRESDYPLSTHYIKDLADWTETPAVPIEEKNRLQKEESLAPIIYVQSDCHTPSDRERYVKELMKYIEIDSYGRCLNNRKMPEEIDGFLKLQSPDYYKFLAQYKFNIAFENAVCNDYMTEKLFRPFEVGAVPIVMGSPLAKDWMPNERSGIFVNDFKHPRELAEFIRHLNSNDDEYEKYMAYKDPKHITNEFLHKALKERPWRVLGEWDKVNFGHRMYAGFECHVCDRVIERQEALRAHHLDPSRNPPPPPRTASKEHLACPEPTVSIATDERVNKSVNFWEGLYEARALKKMLLAGETDTTKFLSKYLKRLTDKYDQWVR